MEEKHQKIGGGWRCSCGTPLADRRDVTWREHLATAVREERECST